MLSCFVKMFDHAFMIALVTYTAFLELPIIASSANPYHNMTFQPFYSL